MPVSITRGEARNQHGEDEYEQTAKDGEFILRLSPFRREQTTPKLIFVPLYADFMIHYRVVSPFLPFRLRLRRREA